MAFDSDAEVAQISSKENAAANQGGATTDQEIDKTPIIPMPSIEAALACAARGWSVFPVHSLCDGACSCGNPKCGSAGKHPRTKHGHKDATRDEQQIHAFWTQSIR